MSLYKSIYQHCWFPFFEGLVKGRHTARIYKELQKTQWLPHEELLRLQSASLRRLLLHAELRSSFYRNRFRQAGLDAAQINTTEDLCSLPLLTKKDIRENYSDLLCEDKSRVWTKATGGSTGEPLRFGYCKDSYAWRVAVSKRGYLWGCAPPGSKQAYIWGSPLGRVSRFSRIKEHLHHLVDRQLYFNCFSFDEAVMHDCLSRMNDFKPDSIIGYATPLYNLAVYIGDSSKVKFVPKGVITAAEKIAPYQRQKIEQVFGAPVFNTYGSREFMLIGAECERHEGLHLSSENLIVEIIKEDGSPAGEGEVGRIIVTDLHNLAMPFIRYEIGDLGVASMKPCSCGRGLPVIADVVGRSLDVIRTPEGKMIPGEFFPHLMKDFSDIKQFQVLQESVDQLVVKLVPAEELSQETMETISREIRKRMGGSVIIDYEILSEIPLTATGKYRVTISKVTGGAHG